MNKSILSFLVIIIINIVFTHDISLVLSQEHLGKSVNDSTLINSTITLVKTIRYVKQTATGLKNGSSWTNASDDLQAMINVSVAGDEIWVASGTFVPKNYPAICIKCITAKDHAFLLKDGVNLYGGFKGDEESIDDRKSFSNNITFLSGEKGTTGIQDNSYHVVISSKNFNETIVDGFYIGNGNASSTDYISVNNRKIYKNSGGAVYLDNSKVSFSNCIFQSNNAILGGAFSINNSSEISIQKCTFINNLAQNGGALAIDTLSDISINECNLLYNEAVNFGGSVFNSSSKLKSYNNLFSNNLAKQGGAFFNSNNNGSEIVNCVFESNKATEYGGAVCNYNCKPFFLNSTLVNNIATIEGGAICNQNGSIVKVKNCILWENSNEIFNDSTVPETLAEVSYSIIKDGYDPCISCPLTNGNADPLFKNILDIRSCDSLFRTSDDGLRLSINSPALDAGDPTSDLPANDIIGTARTKPFDLGAYEFTNILLDTLSLNSFCTNNFNFQTLKPNTEEDFIYTCLLSDLSNATPENHNTLSCDFSTTPTVWFKVETDVNAKHLFTKVTPSSGLWKAKWAVYYCKCDTLKLARYLSTPPCSDEDVTPEVHQTPIYDGINTYYIAVTYSKNDQPLTDNTQFNICAATIPDIFICNGDITDNNNPPPTTKLIATNREFAFLEPNANTETGYSGPFLPGEEVNIKIKFFYDATESGGDWFMGFIPDFGNGWDVNSFDYESYLPEASPIGVGEFHEAGTECAPQVSEYFPYLCTYYDENGVFRLCNELGENCNCDKSYLDPFDPVPSGYFWLSSGSNAGCDNTSCKPHQRWGIGSIISDMNWEFKIRVKNFASEEEYLSNKDLQIAFQTFSDGGLGCWEDLQAECLIDRKQFGPKWKASFEPPDITKVLANPAENEICTGEKINIELMTSDGSEKSIRVFYIDNPSIDGEKEYVFTGGSGIINDTLTINDLNIESPQIVSYYAYVEIPNSSLKIIDTFLVHVYPLPVIEKQNSIPEACVSELPRSLKINGYSSYPGNLLFNWADEKSGKTGSDSLIIIDSSFKTGIHKFLVTLTDDLGCSVTDSLFYKIKSIDTIVTKSGNTLTASETDAQYQWLNCYSAYAKIIGETGQSFTPIINGSYAVEVTKDGCIDTSACHSVIITGIIENTFGDKLKVFPNPTDGKINIEFGDELKDVEITVSDINGKEIFSKKWKHLSSDILDLDRPAGTYIIKIISGEDHANVRVVIQRK